MNHNKQSLDKKVEELKDAVQMEVGIREVLEKFKHYKQVNSKFTDALNQRGYWAYIVKDKYSTKLRISSNNKTINVQDRIDFTVYVSEVMERRPMTWELIENELVRYDFQGQLDQAFEQSRVFEIEKVKFKNLYDFIDKMEFKCFDLCEVKRNLKEKLDYANKQ